MEAPPLERLLSPADVAKILGCSRSQIYALIRQGDLTPVRLRGAGRDGQMRKTRFTREAVLAYINGEVSA